MSLGSDRKLQLGAFSALLIVSSVNYFAHTPLKYLASVTGIVAVFFAAKKLHQHFGVPLFFIRREGVNYWGGAFGGLVGFISSMWGASYTFEQFSLAQFGVDLGLYVIYMTLALTLFMGTVLKDIEDGYLEIK